MLTKKHFIPFAKPFIKDEEINEVVSTLKNGWLTAGPQVDRFEENLSEYLECESVVALSSCSAALFLALKSLKLKEGDEVITTPFTFISTVLSILHAGGKPVLVDIEPGTFHLDPEGVRSAITPKTRAILPVHYGGDPCRMDDIIAIAKEFDLAVIEDAAHAIGAKYKGKMIGNLDTYATCFSFYANKNLSIGEGGALATNNKKLADEVRLLSCHGMTKDAWDRYGDKGEWKYDIIAAGFKSNMTDIQASIGIHQLKRLNRMNDLRRKLSNLYTENLKHLDSLKLPGLNPDGASAHHLYPIQYKGAQDRGKTRSKIIEYLKKAGIQTSVHFIPVCSFPWVQKELGFKEEDYPEAMNTYYQLISLPLYPDLSDEDVCYVTDAIEEYVS